MLTEIQEIICVSIWVTSLIMCAAMWAIAPLLLYFRPMLGLLLILVMIFLSIVPMRTPLIIRQFIAFAVRSAMKYFSIKIVVEDEESIKPGHGYVIGFEPHSVIPVGLPIIFNDTNAQLPKALRECHTLASSAAFRAPLVRQLWWWLGVRPVSRKMITSILQSGKSCALVPGGVREIQFLEKGKEVLYLTKRHGFVRMAIQNGAPIIPVFAFGQSETYSYWRFGPPLMPAFVANRISRAMGMQLLVLWGRWFTSIPNKVGMTIAIGQPIEVPHEKSPSLETVQKILDVYVERMKHLYETHKDESGYSRTPLVII